MTYSIIVPVYDDPALHHALRALQALRFPETDFEVLVIENGKKTDWIEPVVRAANYRYFFVEPAGSYHARNIGMQHAKGTIFCFSDSDCAVDPGWLTTIAETMRQSDSAGVMGFTRGANTTNKIARYEQQMYEANIAGFTKTTALRRIDTRNFAIRRMVFEKIGGFLDDIRFGGDMEYGARAHAAGLKLVYNKKMTAEHSNIEQLGQLLKKRVTQNAANMALLRKHHPAFVQKYFPQLLRFSPGAPSWLWYCLYGTTYTILSPIGHTICLVLPGRLGYAFFKTANVIAIRFGMLQSVVHSKTC